MGGVSRRSFFGGVAALLCAPAIVRVSSLMPIKAYSRVDIIELLNLRMADAERVMKEQLAQSIWGMSLDGVPIIPDDPSEHYRIAEYGGGYISLRTT